MAVRDELGIYGQCVFAPGDWVEYRCIDQVTRRIERDWFLAENLAKQADRLAALNAKGFNIYVGVNRRIESGRTTDAGVDLCRTVFVDFDHLSAEAGVSYDDLAMERIEAAGLPVPTMRVFSGHGVHCYWRLAKPVLPGEWTKAQERLIATLDSDATIKNPERIMRLPGFANVKDPQHPVDCFLLDADPARIYPLADILSHCVATAKPPMAPPLPAPTSPTVGRAVAPPAAGIDHRVARYAAAWPHCSEGDRNSTAYLHACQLVCDFGVPQGQALDLLRTWNAGNHPPLPDAELTSVVQSAGVHHKFTPGAKLDRPRAPGRPSLPPAPRPTREPGEDREPDREPQVGREPSFDDTEPQTTLRGDERAVACVDTMISRIILDWPWDILTQETGMPSPGDVLAFCGPAGVTKTFFMLQALRTWVEAGHAAEMLIMEEDIEHILCRNMAQSAARPGMTNPRWVRSHADEAREIARRLSGQNARLGAHLYELPETDISLVGVAKWIRRRIDAGVKLLIVDPITAADPTDRPWLVEREFVNQVKRFAKKNGATVILTTHPKQGKSKEISLDSLASSSNWVRFCRGVIWLEALKPKKGEPRVTTRPSDPAPCERMVNRIVHILKTRNAPGTGKQVAYWFQEASLTFDEIGIVQEQEKKARKESRPDSW